MRGRLRRWGLILLAMLVLGVSGAGGRTLATTTTVRIQVVGLGSVGDSRGQSQCGNGSTNCRVTYTGSGVVTFTATPAATWSFDQWGGDDCSGSSTCDVTLDLSDQDHDIVANFDKTPDPGSSTVTVTANGETASDGGNVGGGDIDCDTGDTSDCSWEVTNGSTITLLETPDTGSAFGGWTGACSGTSRICTLTVNTDLSLTANFRKPTLTVQVTGDGTVTGGGIACTSSGGAGCTASEPGGSDVTLTATPGAGGSFSQWGGSCTGSTPICTVTMSSDRTVTASFSGSGGLSYALSVSVSGEGTVTGGGLNCGSGGSVCSQNQPAGSTVTLTATPSPGESFTGWGGACSGTTTTCTVTMSAAKSVTATFSGGSTTRVRLQVSVAGKGRVTGGGINCGNGATTCSAEAKQGSTLGLTAVPGAGARFSRWGGACSGVVLTCTVEMDEAKSVSATFTGAPAPPVAGGTLLRSRGRPIVRRTRNGFAVTLRFRTNRRGMVQVRALRAGRLEAALAFTAPAGPAAVGPFPLAKAGFYAFDLTESGRTLHWSACLGRCGEAAARAAGPFVFGRRVATVLDAGQLWSVTLHFTSTQQAGVELRVYRRKKLAREVHFASRVGTDDVALLLSPGTYNFRLTATDAFGRVRSLTWVAFLP